jgi:undecaprenyl-diphosphatase
LAKHRPVPSWELDLTSAINGVPDVAAANLYPVMQLGTVAAPFAVAAGILVWRRDLALAAAAVATGLVAWFGAKGIKRLVERSRPLEFIAGLDVREGAGTGLGFISGHSAVAAASAVVASAAIPRAWRPVVGLLAAVVGVARIVYGVHLPADVVGGWSFGILLGLGALELVDRIAPVAVEPSEEPP